VESQDNNDAVALTDADGNDTVQQAVSSRIKY